MQTSKALRSASRLPLDQPTQVKCADPMIDRRAMEELLSNPLLLLIVGYFLARWDKRGDQQQGGAVSMAALQASIEEKFRTVFSRLESLDDTRAKHDTRISDLVTQVHELVTRLDMLLGLGRADALRRRQIGGAA